jgi:hypothetical protein
MARFRKDRRFAGRFGVKDAIARARVEIRIAGVHRGVRESFATWNLLRDGFAAA